MIVSRRYADAQSSLRHDPAGVSTPWTPASGLPRSRTGRSFYPPEGYDRRSLSTCCEHFIPKDAVEEPQQCSIGFLN